jgi:hypothetical protein
METPLNRASSRIVICFLAMSENVYGD